MKLEEPKKSLGWFSIAILIGIGIIVAYILFISIGTNFLYALVGIVALILIYLIILKFIIKFNPNKVAKFIRRQELTESGISLDIGHIDGMPNVQVEPFLGDLALINYFKENITYYYDIKSKSVIGRANKNLELAKQGILDSKVLIDEILERKRQRLMEEAGETLDNK